MEKDIEEVLEKEEGLSDSTNSFLDEIVEESSEEYLPQEVLPDDEDDEEEEDQEEGKSEEELRKEQNRKNAERRIKNKKAKQEAEHEDEEEEDEDDEEEQSFLEDDDLDAESARVYRERLTAAEDFINEHYDVLNTINELKLDKQKVQMGAQFVEKWTTNPVGLAKELLTFLERRGIDISQVYDHQVDNNQQMIDAEVNRRMQPIVQERMQAQAQQQARQVLDNFLGNYPDAEEHLGEIVEVMRRANLRDPFDAYDRLRRVYIKNGVDWFGREPVDEPVPQFSSKQRTPQPDVYVPKNQLDLIKMNARKYFSGE